MYIANIKDTPQPYLVIYWDVFFYRTSPDIQFLWLKGWKENGQQNISGRWNNLTPFSVFTLKCPSHHQFFQGQKLNILSAFCHVDYWLFFLQYFSPHHLLLTHQKKGYQKILSHLQIWQYWLWRQRVLLAYKVCSPLEQLPLRNIWKS